MKLEHGYLPLVGLALGAILAGAAFAQAPAEMGTSSAPGQPRQFELIAPGPSTRDTSRVPEADFYHDDQRVPYDPAFIAPLTGTTKGGTKYGASVWTSPQTPVGSLGSQIYQQNNGWFGFGLTFMWDASPTGRPNPPGR